ARRLRHRHGAGRRGRHGRQRRLLDQPVYRPRVDVEGADRRGPGRPRLDAGDVRRRPDPRRGRGVQRDGLRGPLPRGGRPRHLSRRAGGAAAGTLREVMRPASAAAVPLVVRREDILNFLFLVLLSIALAQSWNVIAGYAGQVNLGHAAFFGLGALVTRVLWIAGTPVVIGMIAGALVAVAFALLIGWAAFRLRGAYFAIGTLALSET